MNYAAIRALRRALARSARIKAQEEGWLIDRHWDSGEWSDAAHSHIFHSIERVITEQVAQRFGMSADQLENDSTRAAYDEHDRRVNAGGAQ